MKSTFYLLIFFLISSAAYSQTISGIIQSTEDGLSIEGAHIININQEIMAVSSQLGNFEITAEVGDTLVVSNINYITKQLIVRTQKRISILLKPNLIQLEEVLVSNLPKTANDFRKKLIEMPMQDNGKMVPFGVTPGKPRAEIPPLYDQSLNSGVGYVIMNPLKSITRKLSSEFQEKVKYYAIQADKDNKIKRDKKFNRALVASLTGLESDELTNFINHMKLDDSYLDQSTQYEISIRIKDEFENYKKSRLSVE